MPHFPPSEKAKLHQDLLEIGRESFIAQGLKKTSLEQLTQAIGIAKSTFYTFFDSKEALYLELLEMEAAGMEERVWKTVMKQPDVRSGIIAYLEQMTRELDTNLLTKRLLSHPEELEMVKRKVTPAFVGRKMQRNVLPLLAYIERQQKMGRMREADPAVIAGVMRAAMLIEAHRKEIGEEIFAQVKELLFHAVASALTAAADNKGRE